MQCSNFGIESVDKEWLAPKEATEGVRKQEPQNMGQVRFLSFPPVVERVKLNDEAMILDTIFLLCWDET